ncbi:nucleotide sugar dehydrogenase [Photobacterium leiognathi]|uniref:nucleotide sugar dehydrogenase n=1 Tax=Photobacterium leiognathi TaxID=553611 RepID=UPI002981FD1C|nr:nucleotide sugar dehydrogenase [Photobacterium leiognathi]
MNFEIDKTTLGIVGLGYVGLPLAVEFGKKFQTIGFDINSDRIAELSKFKDSTLECTTEELQSAKFLEYSHDVEELRKCNVIIVTVPTPIDKHKQPDLSPLINASELLGRVIKRGDVIIYESTVYPGATEESCVPVLERESSLEFNKDFFVGYSPERINPGDKSHRVTTIKKVTSGSTPEVADFVDDLYNTIITAGTHKATSIKVAEASKVIENVQRDVNIALINELHHIFEKMGIETKEVIEAASTKWNFMKLMPGLVGGHCIGVDPYYLLHKSKSIGYIPDLIRTARVINDGMADSIAHSFLNSLIKKKINPVDCKVLLAGFTFKENCPDIRNTKVYDLYIKLLDLGFDIDVYDPWVCKEDVKKEYNLNILTSKPSSEYDAVMLTVGHDQIIQELNDKKIKSSNNFIYDFKGFLK